MQIYVYVHAKIMGLNINQLQLFLACMFQIR